MKLIAGLGNPGEIYARNLHNIGFVVVDHLAGQLNAPPFTSKFKALISRGVWKGQPYLLVKPMTYMNLSGQAIAACLRFFKISPEDVLLIFDDLDLAPGKVRFRGNGSAGGHRGVRSVIEELNTESFYRVRIGIGRPPERIAPKDYVLSDWDDSCFQKFKEVEEKMIDQLIRFIQGAEFEITSISAS